MKAKLIFTVLSHIILGFTAFSQQSITGMFNSNGVQRGFTGAIPNNAETPLRVVVLFHGRGENGYEMETRGFNEFLGNNTMVVYPIALNRMAGFDGTDTVDDYQMVEDLLTYLNSNYSIDTGDICVGGFSSGAAFTYNLVCDFNSPASTRDYQFKAFAVVSGFVDTNYTNNCSVSRQVPLIAFHGTTDQIALYIGGILIWVESIPAAQKESRVDYWATGFNECDPNPTMTSLADTVTEQFGNSYPELLEYDCPCTANTKFYRIVQGNHAWPGGRAQNDFWQGTNMDINASELIAEFFDFESCDSVGAITNTKIYDHNQLTIIYPNPASNMLFIESDENINNISIYNINGEMLRSYNGYMNQLNIADLKPGFYFLRIESARCIFSHKITIQ